MDPSCHPPAEGSSSTPVPPWEVPFPGPVGWVGARGPPDAAWWSAQPKEISDRAVHLTTEITNISSEYRPEVDRACRSLAGIACMHARQTRGQVGVGRGCIDSACFSSVVRFARLVSAAGRSPPFDFALGVGCAVQLMQRRAVLLYEQDSEWAARRQLHTRIWSHPPELPRSADSTEPALRGPAY